MRQLSISLVLFSSIIASCSNAQNNSGRTQKKNGQPGPLPTVNQVKKIHIKFDHLQFDTVEFTPSPTDWIAIRTAMLPAKTDNNPASWEWVATVDIVKVDGKPLNVQLYQLNKDPGAFAAGPTLKQRVYYRGGSTTKLIKALNTAFDNAEDKTIEPRHVTSKIERATTMKITVAKDSGGFYDSVIVDRDQCKKLSELLDYDGKGISRPPGDLGTTVAADLVVSRKRGPDETLQLRGDLIYFGPKNEYQVKLKNHDLYRELRKLVGDPLSIER